MGGSGGIQPFARRPSGPRRGGAAGGIAAPGGERAAAGGRLAWRVLSAVLFLPVFVWLASRGGLPFLLLVEAIALLGAREACALYARLGARGAAPVALAVVALLPLAGARAPAGATVALAVVAAAAVAVAGAAVLARGGTVGSPPATGSAALRDSQGGPEAGGVRPRAAGLGRSFAATLLPVAYPGVFAAFVWLLREGRVGLGAGTARTSPSAGPIFFLFATTWGCDTAAYFAGRALGRMPLAPSVSPRKTWEGAIAGLVASASIGWLAAGWVVPGSSVAGGARAGVGAPGLLAGALLGVVGQLGDLAESLLKRRAGVKDSAATIPGHGGVLDRFDSVLANAPLLFAILALA